MLELIQPCMSFDGHPRNAVFYCLILDQILLCIVPTWQVLLYLVTSKVGGES